MKKEEQLSMMMSRSSQIVDSDSEVRELDGPIVELALQSEPHIRRIVRCFKAHAEKKLYLEVELTSMKQRGGYMKRMLTAHQVMRYDSKLLARFLLKHNYLY
jgi:hypothetical protein